MIAGLISKGALSAAAYTPINLNSAIPGYPIQVSIWVNNTSNQTVLISLFLSEANETSPSNGDSVYQQYPLAPNTTFNFDVITMSSTESILLFASAAGVNYRVSGVQAPK